MRPAFVILCLLLVGRASSFEERFDQVTTEQGRDDVAHLLGSPDRTTRFAFDPLVMGPPEVLHGIVAEGTEVEEWTWERSASGDTLVFQVYLGDGRVLAKTLHPVGAIF